MSEDSFIQASQAPSFTDTEIRALISSYVKRKDLLEKKHCPAVTEQKKKKAWEDIAVDVNAAAGGGIRTVAQMKKKLSDLRKNAKNWVAFMKYPKTGGGKPKPKLWYYDMVLDLIVGRESPAVTYVRGDLQSAVGVEQEISGTEPNEDDLESAVDVLHQETSGTQANEDDLESAVDEIEQGRSGTKANEGNRENAGVANLQRPVARKPSSKMSTKQLSSACHLSNRKRTYDDLVKLDIMKISHDLEVIQQSKKDEANKMTERKIAVQRQRLQLKRERALMNIEIEKEMIMLEREKVKLELDKQHLEKAKLEVQELALALQIKQAENMYTI